jgi:hypothetical protein
VSSCGTAIRSGTPGMVRGTKVPSNGGLVVLGTDWVTILHHREMEKQELPPPLEVVLSHQVLWPN